MWLEFETINFHSEIGINGWGEKRIIKHQLIDDFYELEDGALRIVLYEGTDSFVSRSFTKHGLINMLKECDLKE